MTTEKFEFFSKSSKEDYFSLEKSEFFFSKSKTQKEQFKILNNNNI